MTPCADPGVSGMLLFPLLLWFLPPTEGSQRTEPMFTAVTNSVLPPDYDSNPTQLNYGVAVTDVDHDGDFEIVVAGSKMMRYSRAPTPKPYAEVGVSVSEDKEVPSKYGPENLLVFPGPEFKVVDCETQWNPFRVATYTDKLFKFRNNRWEDILSDEVNVARGVASLFAGRSVACVDRKGSGRYSIYIANYAYGNVGPDALIEMDPEASDLSRGILALRDVAAEAGVSKYTGGRGVSVGPILSSSASDIFCDNENGPNFLFHNQGNGTFVDAAASAGGRGVSVGPILSSSASDIFCDNENGPNFLFHNQGNGTFVDAAASAGVDDPHQHGRGVALADFNRDGKVDIVYGNWNGPHRLYLQMSSHGKVRFRDIASPKFSMPSPVRTVIAADFDNDQELEIFFNNIAYRSSSANRLFRVIRREHGDPLIEELNPGDALEPEGRGTGGVVTDFDGDGMLDLILSHGESMAQPLSVFRGNQGFSNNWLRVVPRTRFGAFARGAKVVLYTKKSGAHLRIIDGGSGYLCEMEPVAHFGLGRDEASSVEVTWPDGKMVSQSVASEKMNSVLEILYPRDEDKLQDPAPLECGQGFSQQENGHCMDTNECIQFPFVCPRDKPVCVNTYGSYRCRTNKRCSRGFEPNEDGTACVASLTPSEESR
ncbi:Hypothetical predicted protein [Marmota monax]|uniref:EGF-like calcium-binding domain-containing protein n=1 Tax=Marmota monax TaxID=9995 RepID=A0A5E4AMQ7_MARMO|nr:Hypothetical predicted protein [Marmota monax]